MYKHGEMLKPIFNDSSWCSFDPRLVCTVVFPTSNGQSLVSKAKGIVFFFLVQHYNLFLYILIAKREQLTLGYVHDLKPL